MELQQARLQDDALVFDLHNTWVRQSSVAQLKQAVSAIRCEEWQSFRSAQKKKAHSIDVKCKGDQTCIYQFLLQKMEYPSLEEVLAVRFRRWYGIHESGMIAKRAVVNLKRVQSLIPACVQFAAFNTLLNGWATAARFQMLGACRLSISCDGNDSLEHYACCRHQLVAINGVFDIPIMHSLHQLLGLESEDAECSAIIAMHCFAIRSVVNAQRAIDARLPDGAARRALMIEHSKAMSYSTALRTIAVRRTKLRTSSSGLPPVPDMTHIVSHGTSD